MVHNQKPKAFIAWSSGKDSAYAFYLAQQSGEFEIVGALTTITSEFNRVSMHGVREELLDKQMEQLGLPITKVRIPSPCPNTVYESKMGAAIEALLAKGVSHVIFGDLFLADIRAYRETQMSKVGLTCVFPLWLKDPKRLADEMIASGLVSIITCVDSKALAPEFAGRTFAPGLLQELPEGVDPCGENGEFHTFVVAGPMFRTPIPVVVGEVVDRDGLVFADVMLA